MLVRYLEDGDSLYSGKGWIAYGSYEGGDTRLNLRDYHPWPASGLAADTLAVEQPLLVRAEDIRPAGDA